MATVTALAADAGGCTITLTGDDTANRITHVRVDNQTDRSFLLEVFTNPDGSGVLYSDVLEPRSLFDRDLIGAGRWDYSVTFIPADAEHGAPDSFVINEPHFRLMGL